MSEVIARQSKGMTARFGQHRALLRPLIALALLLVIDFMMIPGFFRVEIKDASLTSLTAPPR
jgi:hypothetical protein